MEIEFMVQLEWDELKLESKFQSNCFFCKNMIYHYNIIYSLNDFAHTISNIIYYFK